MPKQSLTPLAYLMDMLYIQGTQLAKMVHVDRTIISRWKNGRAELNMKSHYFEDVIDAVLDVNDEQGIQTLERFFSSINRTKVSGRDELKKAVAAWLVSENFKKKYMEPDTGNSLYEATYKIYKGPAGKRDALQYILDIANSLPGEEVLWGYDADSHIFHTKSNETPLSQKQFIDAAKSGKKLITMLYMNRPAEEVANMFEYWLPIFLSPNSQAYYTYDPDIPFYDYIYSIKGKCALVGANHENDRAKMYTAVYDDPMSVLQIDLFLEEHLKKFNTLMKHLQSRDLCEDFKEAEIAEYMKKDMNQYVIVDSSPFVTYSKETIEYVIFELQLNAAEERRIMQFYRNCTSYNRRFLNEKNFTRLIFNMEHIEELLSVKSVEAPVFSSLLGRDVKISSKYVAREIRSFLEQVRNISNVEVALRPLGHPPFIPNLNIWTKESSIAYFYPSNDARVRVVTDEFASVNAFYKMLDIYWNQLPYECKRHDWVFDQMGRLLKKL